MRLPHTPPELTEALIRHEPDVILRAMREVGPVDERGRYLHWDELRNRKPPAGMTHEIWWVATDFARRGVSRDLPLEAKDGSSLRFANVDEVQRCVHEVDQQVGGRVGTSEDVSPHRARRFARSLEEEAITSSQLEGATTTRQEAKRMLATGREPRDVSERMILNNYRAMARAKEMVGSPLTPDIVLQLHRVVTEGTLDDAADAGRLQTRGDVRVGVHAADDTLVHEPPPADDLPARLVALCDFANGGTGEGFLHPVVRAMIVHFMLSYDHPFSDGNGRTARALFYWSMLGSGYSLIEYVSISSLLKDAPAQYSRAFQHTETDGGDVTYFVLHQLRILLRAIDELWAYVDRRAAETRQIESLVRSSDVLNHRQLSLIRSALHDPNEPITIAEHQHAHGVTHETARHDLGALVDVGLYERRRRGRAYAFLPKPGLEDRLRALGDES